MSTRDIPLVEEVPAAEKVAFLGRPEAYGGGVKEVELVETHLSWVFLTEHRAYKLKKPIVSAFADLRSLESRKRNCRQSVRLNRRLADEIYLGTLPLSRGPGGKLMLGGDGEVIDWLIEMHRLPANRMLDASIRTHTVRPEDVQRVSDQLNTFYRTLRPIPMESDEYLERFIRDIQNTLTVLSHPDYGLPLRLVEHLASTQQQFIDSRGSLLAKRAQDRHIIEGHGDLRPEHVCLIEPPVVIDCLESGRAIRFLDPADELAYLALECERLGDPGFGRELLHNYRESKNQVLPEALVAFYGVFRAWLRAKITIWHLDDPSIQDRTKWRLRSQEYLRIAERRIPAALHG